MLLARARSLQARLLPHGVLDVVRQVLLFAAAYYAYRLVRGWIDDPQGATVAFDNARHLIHVEQTMGFFVEPSIQAWASTKPAIIDFASWVYLNCQTSVTVGALVFLYLFHNKSFYFVRNMFMVAMGFALIGYMIYPTAPPRMLPEFGFVDTVADFTGVSESSVASTSRSSRFRSSASSSISSPGPVSSSASPSRSCSSVSTSVVVASAPSAPLDVAFLGRPRAGADLAAALLVAVRVLVAVAALAAFAGALAAVLVAAPLAALAGERFAGELAGDLAAVRFTGSSVAGRALVAAT